MRRGWTYSLFAGIVALPVAIWFAWLQHGPKPSLLAATMTLAAMVAARVGGWLAILSGGRDHGWRAATYTGVIYLLFCGALGVILLYLPDAPHDAWALIQQMGAPAFAWRLAEQTVLSIFLVMAIFAWWTLLPACVVGTLAFHLLLRIRGRQG